MWCSFFLYLPLLGLFLFEPILGTGNFWFITDFHVDQNYSRTGNPGKLCHQEKKAFPDNGLYGNFFCDAPLTLVDATIIAMKSIHPKPDFIVWTGDNLPHTRGYATAWKTVFEGIRNITDALIAAFPGIPVFPSIGNHDTSPKNILQPNASSDGLYDEYLEQGNWNKILSKEAQETFKQGGYYSEIVKPGLRLISLNTILWYDPNVLCNNLEDPNNQMKWLSETLKSSKLKKEKVYIIGHVAPGYYNRNEPNKKSPPTLHLSFQERYLKLLSQYYDIISGQMYGHVHMDYFQLFSFNTDTFKSSSIVASSVTPWHYANRYNVILPVNPSIKLMQYSDKNFTFKDFDQYYLNLSKVNDVYKKDPPSKTNLYEHLYKFTEAYGVPDLTTESLATVYDMLKKNETVFEKFFWYLTAGKQIVNCDEDCKVAQLCAMSGNTIQEYDICMETRADRNVPDSGSVNITAAVVVSVLVIILIVLFIVHQNCWSKNRKGYHQKDDSSSSSA